MHALKRVAIAASALLAASSASATVPDWLNCPAAAEIAIGEGRDRGLDAIRAIAPSAGAVVSTELAAHAELSMLSYEMYDAFERGDDPGALSPAGFSIVGLIHGDPGRFTERRSDRGVRDTRTFYGFVADEAASGRRVIVLRGTLQPNEWLRNLQARQRPYPSGERRWRATAWVHGGFLEIFESLTFERENARAPLVEALPDLVAGNEVAIIGHSLGGALAVLVGVDAARVSPAAAGDLEIVTFGAPRVGDPGFAALARSVGRITRVCNLTDLVAAVPTDFARTDYVHVGDVFRVSSFDWPRLDNALDRDAQIVCWHSIYTYGYIADPDKTERAEHALCLKP